MAMMMTHRMRKALSAWELQHASEEYEDAAKFTVDRAHKMKLLWDEELANARATAYLDAVRAAEAAKIRKEVRAGDFTQYPALQPYAEVLKEKPPPEDALAWFVTVNPKPDVSVPEFKRVVEKYAAAKMVTAGKYAFEQRGSHELELGKGMHAHFLITMNTNPADFIKRTRAAFKNVVGNPEHHVDVRRVPDAESVKRREAYISGTKVGEDKMIKVGVDKIWRAKENLEPLYNIGNGSHEAADSSEGSPDRP